MRVGASGVWLAAIGSTLLLSGCGGGEPETVTVIETVTQTVVEPVEAVPDASETAPSGTDSSGPVGATERKIGGTGSDEGLAFRVTRLAVVSSIPQTEYSDPLTVTPVAGAKLVTADVTVTNNGDTSVDPFCGGTGAVLLDEADRNFDPLSQVQISIPGNTICGDGIQPGFKARYTLAFQIPKSATVGALVLWNSNSVDYDRKSYVLFVK